MKLVFTLGILVLVLSSAPAEAQPFAAGSVTADFSLKDRRTGLDVSLSDFQGQVIVLDFFAYWCPPCAFSSPDIEDKIQKFYAESNGNAHGVPVEVISVNIENEDPDKTNEFIAATGLELVVDDTEAVAWNLYNQTNGIPLFVIINGVAESPTHDQWEVLHNAPSYPGAEFFRQLIDSVEAPVDVPAPDPMETAIDLGDDWRWIPWFGSFKTTHLPWIFHEEHGWIYLGSGNLTDGQLFFDVNLGWIWTDSTSYPYIYSIERNNWLLYSLFSQQPRIFNEAANEETLAINKSRGPDPSDDFFANGFDLTNASIDVGEVLSGGPPRDGIPAINDPQFLSIAQVSFMEDSDILVAVTSGGETRGYPFRILNWHEIVNDRIGEDEFVVTYCPLCGTAVVFDAVVNGRKRTFGVSGLLFRNNLLMYDQESESLWSQFMLQSVIGPMMKTRLQWRFSEQMTWRDFKAKYPNGTLLSTNTGFNRDYTRDPYAAYFESGGPLFRTANPIRADLPVKEWVWGIVVGDTAKAYPLDILPDAQPIRDTVAGVELELVLDAQARSILVTVVETNQPLDNGFGSFWFSWQDFFPDTEVFSLP